MISCFLFLFLHLGRAISYASYFYNPNTWFSGILLGIFLMATAFMGYVLPLVNNGFSLSSFFLSLLSYLQLRTTAIYFE
eukprot:UN3898